MRCGLCQNPLTTWWLTTVGYCYVILTRRQKSLKRQAWCNLQVKLRDPCLSALEVVTTMRYTNRRILCLLYLLYSYNLSVSYIHEMPKNVCDECTRRRVADVIAPIACCPIVLQIFGVFQDADHWWSQHRAPRRSAVTAASMYAVLQPTRLKYVTRVLWNSTR